MAGLITRQELASALRAELDDVKNYIEGSNNAEMGAHMSSKNNPHSVTKAQVGLSAVSNVLQASKSEFDAHTANKSNPHGVTAGQISAVPTARTISAGTGLSGGGTLSANRTISLNLTYTDGRYLRSNGGQVTGELTVTGQINVGSINTRATNIYTRPVANGELRVTRVGTTNVYENARAKGFLNASGQLAYHKGSNIKWGTGNPSGGSDGDIYIQY